MALSPAVIDIPLQQGIDTKEAPYLVDNARFSFLQDVVFDRGNLGELHKRNGHSAIIANTLVVPGYSAGKLTNLTPQTLTQFNTELDVISSNTLYSGASNGFIPKGQLLSFDFSETQISSSVNSGSNPDSVLVGTLQLFAWEENNSVNIKLIDSLTGVSYFQQTMSVGGNTSLSNPKVLSNSIGPVLLFNDANGNVYISQVTTTQPYSITSPSLLLEFAVPVIALDACVVNNVVDDTSYHYIMTAVAYGNTDDQAIEVDCWDLTTFAESGSPLTVVDSTNVECLCLVSLGTNAFLGTALRDVYETNVNAYFLNAPPSLIKSYTDLDYGTNTGSYVQRMTAINGDATGATSTSAFFLIEQPPQNSTTVGQVIKYDLNTTSDGGYLVPFVGMQLASQPWWQTYDPGVTLNILACYASQVQQTLFVLSDINEVSNTVKSFDLFPMSVAAKAYEYNAGPPPANNRLPAIQINSIVSTNETVLTSAGGIPVIVTGVNNLTFTPTAAFQSTQLGQNTMITTGSLVYDYDGLNLVEHNFNTFPEAPVVELLTSNLTLITDIQANQSNIAGSAAAFKAANVFATSETPGKGLLFTAQTTGTAGNGIQVILIADGTGLISSVVGNVITVHYSNSIPSPEILASYMNGIGAITALISITVADSPETGPYMNAGNYTLTGGSDTAYPTTGPQQVNHLYIPDNPQNPGGPLELVYVNQFGEKVITSMITPGEYIMFGLYGLTLIGASAASYVFYFVVNGAAGNWDISTNRNSAISFPLGANAVPVFVDSDMTAIETATAIITAMNGTIITATSAATSTPSFGFYTATYEVTPQGGAQNNPLTATQQTTSVSAWTPQVITILGATNTAISQPALNRKFTVQQIFNGSEQVLNPQNAVFSVTCCPANLITGGQYFSFGLSNATGTFDPADIQSGYVWFTVANEGVDPNPFGYNDLYNTAPLPGINVVLTGSENEQQVANAIVKAFSVFAPGSGYGVNAYANGPQLYVAAESNDSRGVIPVGQYANNPVNGGVEMNYIDQNTDAVVNADIVQYAADYEWVDGQGQLHQSSPSVPTNQYLFSYLSYPLWISDTAPGIGSAVPVNAVCEVFVNPLNATLKSTNNSASTTNVNVAIFRTQTNETVLYKITSPTNVLQTTPNQLSYVSFIDNSPDSPTVTNAAVAIVLPPTTGIASNTPLYTTGGVLEYDAPPAATAIINHQDRIVLASAEQPQTIWFSIPWSFGLGVEFSIEQTIRLNPVVASTVGGPITGLGSMDGNLIVFQENAVWIISGTGPNASGNGQPFNTPQLVASSTAIGCRDPGSIVLIPAGIMFKSTQGYYLLTRGLTLEPVGMPVQQYNADIVSSAVVLENNTQVRFLSSAGTTLLFDWFYNSWATFTTQGVASVRQTSNGLYAFLNNAGLVLQEAAGVYSDNGVPFPMVVTTAWIKLNNIQGYGRIWRTLFLGSFPGTETYQVTVAANYNSSIVQTNTWNPNAGTWNIGGVWGSDSPSGYWGSSTGGYWGGEGAEQIVYPDYVQFKLYNNPQLIDSIQFSFSDIGVLDPSQTPALDAISMEVGLRKGTYKQIGNGQTAG